MLPELGRRLDEGVEGAVDALDLQELLQQEVEKDLLKQLRYAADFLCSGSGGHAERWRCLVDFSSGISYRSGASMQVARSGAKCRYRIS